ncbi:uroporphyrinogen-III synthase [Virgibacillus sp. NKC19-16]|uniref:uroporphyrinogen-III synthase n=1 Tax=Virgibacillus salidurans TaxID=2831673 RepID=UPI001F2C41A1|nr:uroporphyrinogen-III synthase [Virgibacillus sp. NKC19-16]UJL44981.1 uroporphyrinogen-III synthase [Virgibacillus sp. NKC19-16]
MSISLHEKKVLITREKKQAEAFSSKVLAYGGIPIEVPLLKILCKDLRENKRILENVDRYEWIFFTSSNGVNCFFQLAKRYQVNNEIFKNKRLAAVGHKTENALKNFGFTADFVPTTYNADTMASEFLSRYTVSDPILLVRGNRSRDVLPIEFSKHGILYDSACVYEISYNYQMTDRLNAILRENTFDFVTFTSPSTVEAFVEMTAVPSDVTCVCIGTTTQKRAYELGFTSILTAEEFTIDGMLLCISNYIAEEEF